MTIALGVLFTGNAGTYYAALETVPVGLASVIVYTYPVFVAILSIRFATRLPGRRPWIALALATVGIVLALGGIDLSEAPPIDGFVLLMASSLIYAIWIIASARLSGERRDRLASEDSARVGSTRDAAATTAVMITSTAVAYCVFTSSAGARSIRAPSPTAPGRSSRRSGSLRRSWRSRRSMPRCGGSARPGSPDQHGRAGHHRGPRPGSSWASTSPRSSSSGRPASWSGSWWRRPRRAPGVRPNRRCRSMPRRRPRIDDPSVNRGRRQGWRGRPPRRRRCRHRAR